MNFISNIKFGSLVVFQIVLFKQCLSLSSLSTSKSPNILFFLTDDHDSEIGGLEPLVKTKRWIADKGVSFENAFASVPLCCPSRASILTGLYQHNTKVLNNSIAGNCYGSEWTESTEKYTFATALKSNSYTTYYAGKYLNGYCNCESLCTKEFSDEKEPDLIVPPGWDYWAGQCGNEVYYNYTLSVNGIAEKHDDQYENDYFTDVIGRKALDWLEDYSNLKVQYDYGMINPFLMVIATTAPRGDHLSPEPAPQYENVFSDIKTPRTPAFNFVNYGNRNKHWLMRYNSDPLDDDLIEEIDEHFRDRWRTLLSVDDMIDDVMKKLEDIGELNNTFVLFTSDHGYHLGTFGNPWGKRLNYENDIRVPFLIRGPGVMQNKTIKQINVNIDIAPTIIEMSGQLVNPHDFDGISLLPYITEEQENLLKRDTAQKRNAIIFSHRGEFDYNDNLMISCLDEWVSKCEDTKNNTYRCMRYIDDEENKVVCRFQDDEKFVEYYDLNKDPYQLNNIPQKEWKPEEKRWIRFALEELENIRPSLDRVL